MDRAGTLRDSVEAAIDRLRPALVADGGNIELHDVDEGGTVRIILQGTWASSPSQLALIRVGIEEPLKRTVPGVTAVVLV